MWKMWKSNFLWLIFSFSKKIIHIFFYKNSIKKLWIMWIIIFELNLHQCLQHFRLPWLSTSRRQYIFFVKIFRFLQNSKNSMLLCLFFGFLPVTFARKCLPDLLLVRHKYQPEWYSLREIKPLQIPWVRNACGCRYAAEIQATDVCEETFRQPLRLLRFR